MDILLLAWNRFRIRRPKINIGHELFRRELAKYCNVVLYGPGYFCKYNPNTTLDDLFEKYGKPNIIFIHIEHREEKFPTGIIDELGKANVLKVHYCGDYNSLCQKRYDDHFKKIQYDIIFAPYTQVLTRLKKYGIGGEHFLLPYSVDTSIFYDRHLEKSFDVASPITIRNKYHRRLTNLINQLDIKTVTGQAIFDEYIKRINETKIIVANNQKYHQLSFKYTEVIACGTLMMGDKPSDFDRLGFKDGEHLILYNNFDDLKDKIGYFLKHDQEREAIAKNGMEFVRKYHSNRVRIAEFIEMIQTRKQINWSERIDQQFVPNFKVPLQYITS